MKAQISMEYVLITGLILMLLMPVFYYSFSTSVQTIKMNEADNLVKIIANTADTLYSLGPGSQDTLMVNMPSGVVSLTLNNKEVLLKIMIFNSVSDIQMSTKANISGSINIKAGSQYIVLKNENNAIKVTSRY